MTTDVVRNRQSCAEVTAMILCSVGSVQDIINRFEEKQRKDEGRQLDVLIVAMIRKTQEDTLTAVTVNPALVLPIPVVRTERGITLQAYFKNCDFPVPVIGK